MLERLSLLAAIGIGIAAYASPDLLGLDGPARAGELIAGPIAASIAAVALSSVTRSIRRLLVLPGAWLAAAPMLLGIQGFAALESFGLGAALIAVALVPPSERREFGGGWLALVRPTLLAPEPDDPPGGGVAASPEFAPDADAAHRAQPTLIPEKENPTMSKIVVITGASAGVGRAAARAFAKDGWDVGLIARGDAGLDGAVKDVESQGQRALKLDVDVVDAAAVEGAAERVERELGPIDVWVNDAMESVFAPADEIEPDEYRRVTEVNYLGYVHGTLAALRRMKARDRGVIIQVGSALAYRSIPLQAAYCGSKHAIVGFTDSLRCELIHDRSRVRLVAVQLPAINTPQFGWVRSRLPHRAQPVPPIFEPEVPARAILHLATHPRRELLVGLPTVAAVWGQKFIPGLLDVYLGRTGYAGQQTGEPRRAHADNLEGPQDDLRDRGAEGRFGSRARSWAPLLELDLHRGAAMAVAAAGAMLLIGTRLWRSHPDG
jgi:NAD(P)-dependent dehydrogenase (short-subunit alcohol dehydrogenase family)